MKKRNKQYVWDAEKEEFILSDVYEALGISRYTIFSRILDFIRKILGIK